MVEPGRIMRAVWTRKWLILLTALVGVGAAFLFSDRGPQESAPVVYRAMSTVRIQPIISDTSILTQVGKRNPSNRTYQAHAQIMKSQAVVQQAVARLSTGTGQAPSEAELRARAESISSELFVTPLPGTDLLQLVYKAPSREVAEATLNAIVGAYRDFLLTEQRQNIQEALVVVDQSITEVSGSPTLGQEINPSLIELATEVNTATLVAEAGRQELTKLRGALGIDRANLTLASDPALSAAAGDLQSAADQMETVAARVDGILKGTEGPTEQQAVQLALNDMAKAVASVNAVAQDLQLIEKEHPWRVANAGQTESEIAVARSTEASFSSRLTSTRQLVEGVAQVSIQLIDSTRKAGANLASKPDERALLVEQTNTVIRSLASAAGALASLRQTPGIVLDVNAQARMIRDEAQLMKAGADMEAVVPSLEGRMTREIQALSTQLQRVRASALSMSESLNASLAPLSAREGTPEGKRDEVARKIRESIKDIRLNMDVLARQMEAMVENLADPFARGEFAAISARVRSSGDAISSAIESLARIESGLDDPTPRTQILKAEGSAGMAAEGLRYVRERMNVIKPNADGTYDIGVVRDIEAGAAAVAVTLQVYAHDIDPLVNSPTDAAQRARLRLVAEQIREAGERVSAPATMIGQYEEEAGSAADRWLRLRKDLQAMSTQPEETGMTLLETVSAPEAGGSIALTSDRNVSLALGALAGLLVGVLGAIATESVGRRVRNEDDLRALGGTRILGPIPRAPRDWRMNPPLAHRDLASLFAGSTEMLATRIQDALAHGARVQVMSSPGIGDGKTTVGMNLAEALARRGRNVLFIDADLRKPDATRAFGLTESQGIGEAIEQGRDIGQSVARVGNVNVLPAGKTTTDPVGMLATPAFENFLKSAKDKYDAVIVDGPPVLGSVDGATLARQTDGAILVTRAGKTLLESTNAALEALRSVGAKVTGAVLNASPERAARYVAADRRSGKRARAFQPARAAAPQGGLVTKP